MNGWYKSGTHKLLKGLLLVCLMLLVTGEALPFWHTIIWETYEQDFQLWPWETHIDPAQGWGRAPTPPNGNNRTWAVEESSVFYPSNPTYYRSIWASGDPDDLIPGINDYDTNQNSWAWWGPFDITEEMATVGGVVWIWQDYEQPWFDGAGDTFMLGISNTEDPADRNYPNWPISYNSLGLSNLPTYSWRLLDFSFDELDSAGVTISYLSDAEENNRLGCNIALIFVSNNSDVGDGLGVFIDDFVMGYDDGTFDYEIKKLRYVNAEDTIYSYPEVLIGNPFRVRADYTAHGVQEGIEVSHVLYIDFPGDEEGLIPMDTVRGAWDALPTGENHRIYFDPIIVPEDTVCYQIEVRLDAFNEQEEKNDSTNNDSLEVLCVSQAQAPPAFEWLIPGSEYPPEDIGAVTDTDYVDIYGNRQVGIVPLRYGAINSPDWEWADVTLYFDDDTTGADGIWITGAYGQAILPSEPEYDILWNVESNKPEWWGENDTVYVYSTASDYWFPSVVTYAPYPVVITPVNRISDDLGASADIPTEFSIEKVYPNPFNPTVEIQYGLPASGNVSVEWYSIDGRLVDSDNLTNVQAGYHTLSWTPGNLSSGMYLLKLNHDSGTLMTNVIFTK